MNDLTFNILKIVVSVSTAFIAAYLIPLIREKLSDARYSKLIEIIEVAIRAAEQTITGTGMGHYKKDEVLAFVTAWMLKHGVTISEEQLDQLIEAAVYNLKQEAK